jgi:hypothetical protein
MLRVQSQGEVAPYVLSIKPKTAFANVIPPLFADPMIG